MFTSSRFLVHRSVLVLVVFWFGCQQASENLSGPTQDDNGPPRIVSVSTSVRDVSVGGVSILTCSATDPKGDQLSYSWNCERGQIAQSGSSAFWTAPASPDSVTIEVLVTNTRGSTARASILLRVHRNNPRRILIDASRDGGVWWFPQWEGTGFSQTEPHQGKALADFIRSKGFQVDELPRTATISDSLLNQYDKVIIAASHYSAEADIQKYMRFLDRPTSLILIGEFLRSGQRNLLAERLGIRFAGVARGYITRFAIHQVTQGAQPFYFNAGSIVLDTTANPAIRFLGWLSNDSFVDLNDNGVRDPNEPTGMPVMGVLSHQKSKIFFLGDVNGLQGVPQPFVNKLITWAFE